MWKEHFADLSLSDPPTPFHAMAHSQFLKFFVSINMIQMSPGSIPTYLLLFFFFFISFCTSELPFPHPLWIFLHSRLPSLGFIPTLFMFFLHSWCYVRIYANHSQVTVSSLVYSFQLHIHLNVPQKPKTEPSQMPPLPLPPPPQIYFPYTPTAGKRTTIHPNLAIWESNSTSSKCLLWNSLNSSLPFISMASLWKLNYILCRKPLA